MKKILRRLLNPETISYLIFGILTTLVNFAVYYALRHFEVNYVIAGVIAWIFAVSFAFFTNKHFVFKSHDYSPSILIPEALKFAAGRIVTLLIEQGLMIFTVEVLHFDDRIMKLLIAVLVIVLNYVFSKLIIFKNSHKEPEHEV